MIAHGWFLSSTSFYRKVVSAPVPSNAPPFFGLAIPMVELFDNVSVVKRRDTTDLNPLKISQIDFKSEKMFH